MIGETVLIRVDSLKGSDSPRARGVEADHVRSLVEAGARLPPIIVHRASMRVIDGMHRLTAARLAGRSEVEARFFEGTVEEAFVLGVAENTKHGLPLSLADRRAAAARIMQSEPMMSNRSIAAVAGLAPKTVAGIRAALEGQSDRLVRAGRDGRLRPLKATQGRLEASAVLAAQPDISLRALARAAGISIGTARDVRLRLQAGLGPLTTEREAGRSGRRGMARTVRAADHSAAGPDLAALLGTLRRDPALRYSDPGRALLRWLESRMFAMDQMPLVSEGIPPHCVDNVAMIAKECARVWTAFAEQITKA